MKQLVCSVFLIGMIGIQGAKAQEKKFTETIKKEMSFDSKGSDNTLVLQNLNGSITLEGYEGSTIQLSVEKTIMARNTEKLELGKREIGIKLERTGNKVIVYPEAPNLVFKNGSITSANCNSPYNPEYDHLLNFTVRVPKYIKVEVSTVNHGDVEVRNTEGDFIKAVNVNGHITLNNITGQTDVNAINGEVNVSYASNPKGPSKYYALNGDINIKYQKNLSAAIAFKSMNGELYTNFDIEKQYTRTSKNEGSGGTKAKYTFEAKPIVQVGSGALDHSFETLNGDVIIKKI